MIPWLIDIPSTIVNVVAMSDGGENAGIIGASGICSAKLAQKRRFAMQV